MKYIDITLDVSKINKSKIVDRKFRDKEGIEHTAKEYKIKVVELKERKFITKGDGWELFKTHFVVEQKDKKEDPDNFVGNGFEFVREAPRNVAKLEPEDSVRENEMPNFDVKGETFPDINPDDIPF